MEPVKPVVASSDAPVQERPAADSPPATPAAVDAGSTPQSPLSPPSDPPLSSQFATLCSFVGLGNVLERPLCFGALPVGSELLSTTVTYHYSALC